MTSRIYKKVFVVFFGLYFALGFIAGNAIGAMATHTLRKDISAGMAIAAAVGCLIACIAAMPLPKVLIRFFDRSFVFGGNSLMFWQILTIVAGVFGVIFGSLLPNGPFQVA
ncbi:MAG: hypothetical protein ACTHM6_09210 [Tepidisphaeraceae bacterium]